jgi:ribose transport system permease protein
VINWATPGMGFGLAVLFGSGVAVLVAAIPGIINGMLVALLKVPPYIGTLGNGKIYGIPYIILVTAVFVLVMRYLLGQTKFGQHNYAICANAQAARRAGINIKWHLLRLYILSGMRAGLADVLYAARFSAGAAQAGEPFLLDSVAAVVIDQAQRRFSGGRQSE